MSILSFIKKQFIDVIQWTEESDGVLAWRYPMEDAEIQYGAQLTVRESQLALFVNEGKIADQFGPGLYKLETRTLPLLTNLMNWDKLFESPFKSDVYFYSTRLQINQRWGTQNPVTIRDRDFGMVRLRGHGVFSYRINTPDEFYRQVSGTRPVYTTEDLSGHLRNTIIGKVSDAFAESKIPFLDMAANLNELSHTISQQLAPVMDDLGLELHSFQVQSLSLPEELQKKLDERIGMNMAGNLKDYTQYQVAQSMPIAAANPGGGAGLGAGLGAGMAMGKAMVDGVSGNAGNSSTQGGAPASTPSAAEKFCSACGKPVARAAKFCSECGAAQG
jgi:membrane protease subunit (stomatin/prohibitin family)